MNGAAFGEQFEPIDAAYPTAINRRKPALPAEL